MTFKVVSGGWLGVNDNLRFNISKFHNGFSVSYYLSVTRDIIAPNGNIETIDIITNKEFLRLNDAKRFAKNMLK